VTEVNRSIRTLLEESVPPVWIAGEVAGWTRARSGHCYFTLKDEASQIKCVLFRTDSARLTQDPSEGTRVRVYGGLTLYEARGDYQLVARRLEQEQGEGDWRRAFEQLRRQLEAEGLLAPERKRPLPALPGVIGVVTSADGAALRDILVGLGSRAPWVRVLVRAARVQGEGSATEISRAIQALCQSGQPDLLIVGRGGGSIEDLWAFNDEGVARAIAASTVPVVSAVGHETDVTISDLVADLRAPTPTAAATLAIQSAARRLDNLPTLRPRLERGLRSRLDRVRVRTARGGERLAASTQRLLDRRRAQAGALAGRLDALSPLRTLERGYAVALDERGAVVRRTSHLPAGAAFTLRLPDGILGAQSTGPVSQASES